MWSDFESFAKKKTFESIPEDFDFVHKMTVFDNKMESTQMNSGSWCS